MHLVMFDIDGTLVQSYDFDEKCYVEAVEEVLGCSVDGDWSKYQHVTDSGILDEIILNQNLKSSSKIIHAQVKSRFIEKVSVHLKSHGILTVAGAPEFISFLREQPDIKVAIATGGWRETALLKLETAGFDLTDVSLASSTDHGSRVEIMKIAESRCGSDSFSSKTYFGDALWDKNASSELGYEFVLVGDRIIHDRKIADFRPPMKVLSLIGLRNDKRSESD